MLDLPELHAQLAGRSAFLVGDCWERRLIEHVCKEAGRPLESYDQVEPFAFVCRVPLMNNANLTLGFAHISGSGRMLTASSHEYMPARMLRLSSSERAVEMLSKFREKYLNGIAPDLVMAQSYAHDFAGWSERYPCDPAKNKQKMTGTTRHRRTLCDVYEWWSTHQHILLPEWLSNVENLTQSLGAASPNSALYWNTRYLPISEFAVGTVGLANNQTTPNFPGAYHSMSEGIRALHTTWKPHKVQLFDMARYSAGLVLWYYGDGLHQTAWASQAFARVLFNLIARLPGTRDQTI